MSIAYEIHGRGAPVVLVHGLTFDRTTWRPIVERLDGSVRSIALDLPAHGESGGRPVPLQDVAAQVHDLVVELGVERPVVVGHSMSGAVALIYGGTYPARGVVVVDQGVDVREFGALVKRLEPALRGDGFASVFERFQESMGIDLVPEPMRSQVLAAQRVEQDVVVGYWSELMGADLDELQAEIDGRMARLEVPCLGVFVMRLPRRTGRDSASPAMPSSRSTPAKGTSSTSSTPTGSPRACARSSTAVRPERGTPARGASRAPATSAASRPARPRSPRACAASSRPRTSAGRGRDESPDETAPPTRDRRS